MSELSSKVRLCEFTFRKITIQNKNMLPIGPQSAFGHYRAEKNKAGMAPLSKKIKGKYNDLVNKKNNKRIKKAAFETVKKSSGKVSSGKPEGPKADWSVRRVQFDQLNNGKAKPKKQAEFEEDSRVAGKKVFQNLLNPIDVDRFMR